MSAPEASEVLEALVRREQSGRILRFAKGEVHILDEVSRTRIPILADRAAKLSEIFEIDRELLTQALERAGDSDPVRSRARIEVYREERARELFDLLTTAEGYRRFIEGLGSVEVRSTDEQNFEVTIAPEKGESVLESVRVDPEGRLLTIDRTSGLARTGFLLESTDRGERLVHFADLPDAREEFLRSDVGRSRIVAILAMDLVALSRL